jgi:hypothetical protein
MTTAGSGAYGPSSDERRAHAAESRAIAEAFLARPEDPVPWRLRAREPYSTSAQLEKTLPDPITRVFLITGRRAQAAHDFRGALAAPQMQLIETRFAQLNSERTPSLVARTISQVPARQGHVIVLVRGGGDDGAALWAFDHPEVVRAITVSPTPVVTALGHRSDVTWADRVAAAAMPVPGDLGTAFRRILGKQHFARQRRESAADGRRTVSASGRSRDTGPGSPIWTARHHHDQAGPTPGARPRWPSPPPPMHMPMPMSGVDAASPAGRRRPRGLGVASLVIGIASLVSFGALGVTPLLGLVLGLVGLARRPRAAAVAGVIINAMALSGWLLAVMVSAVLGTVESTMPPSGP